jgi:hypothetical protein
VSIRSFSRWLRPLLHGWQLAVLDAGKTLVNVLSGPLPGTIRLNGRDELPLIRLGGGLQTFRPNIWDRCGASPYTDEQAAVASLWRALVIRRLEVAELAATKDIRRAQSSPLGVVGNSSLPGERERNNL